jgi:hypothetical protein
MKDVNTSVALSVNRRKWLQGLLALATPIGLSALPPKRPGEEHTLRNANLDFHFAAAQGKVTSRHLVNRLANETVELPEADFALEFNDHAVAAPSEFKAEIALKGQENLEILYSGATPAVADLQVRIEYSLPPTKDYLRKQISVRQTPGGKTRRLMRADLDLWTGVRRIWKSAASDPMPYGSHPIFCDTLWAGLEFVAAFNTCGSEGFILRSRPGGKTLTSDWLRLHCTVVGVAQPGKVKEAFLRYIEDIRLAPPRWVACYDTWYSLRDIYSEKVCLRLLQTLVKSLYEKHGVFFDFVSADMGWSDPHSIWAVNQTDFPNGLGPLVEAIKSAGGQLGLWMSPSEVYDPVIDYAWATGNGYTVVPASKDPANLHDEGISLADPKYFAAAKTQLRRLIDQNQLGQIKFDGLIAREEQGHHNLLPGEDSIEPLAECSLELLAAAREANPKVFTETTYLNSILNYTTPWMLKYSNSVWAGAGSDCVMGIGPAPDYRESQTTSREFFVMSALDEVWLPQNAMQCFDILHCDAAGGFPNHAAMAFGRGRFFVSTYINPKFMTDADWQIYAGLLRWARRNQEVLQNTAVVTSRVELGEPYAYAHWSGTRGILAVRNPSNESKEFALDMAKAGAPQGLSQAVCYTQYPYRKGVTDGFGSMATIALDLAPWELVFLEVVPHSELLEPVSIGARWYRGAKGNMNVSSEGSRTVRVLLPGGGEQVVATNPLAFENPRGDVRSQQIEMLPSSDWFRQGDKPLATASFELDCEISIPEGAARGEVLLLLEFPGKEHLETNCTCQVNGRAVALRESSSAAHIGDYGGAPASAWNRLEPYASHWTWYICELASGRAEVKFGGTMPYDRCKIGLWAWADWDLAKQGVPVSIACPEPAMPQYQDNLKRRGTCILPPGVLRESPR